ncbi:MAG TPA: Asp-tRNA(Asn)/Glu-tRNA(Gln) amidotransferase subunit GatC [Candidatus Portnoybacteria bacterium]|nr:Asp-tRNA(Asn)/Glu-tRNA(Gln) amidotransferase subunit GatC [Candidatus Portnoybacteria bacterium]
MFSKNEIQHIAELAKIKLKENDLDKFGREFEAILSFVKKLQEVNTDNIEPVNGGTFLENILREDDEFDIPDKLFVDKFIANAPKSEGKHLKVKKIL